MKPYHIAVLTVSDRCSAGIREDQSGPIICDRLGAMGKIIAYRIVPDDHDLIVSALIECADMHHADLILTTGGTGLSPRDVTPEATMQVIDRVVPGIPEAIRAASLLKTPMAMLSRAVAGTRGKTLIINLPGSPRAVHECLDIAEPVLVHAMTILGGHTNDCARPQTEGIN